MLARVVVATPFAMVVPDNTRFENFTYEDEGYSVTVMPPMRSDAPIYADIPDMLGVGGVPAFLANAFYFEFRKDSFNRARGGPMDPPERVLRRCIDGLLARLRYVTRGFQVSSIDFPNVSWHLRYLRDDGTELEENKDLVRGLGGRRWTLSAVGIDSAIWNEIHSLSPDWTPPPWDDILLDASAALPKVGSAVVLAATALEVFIEYVLDHLALKDKIPVEVWRWINHRDDWEKEPSTEEQFDFLLNHFVGHSLKKEESLWQAFKNLRTARNKFVHAGVAIVGGKTLTPADALQLIVKSHEIVNWVYELLPMEMRWPRFTRTVSYHIGYKLP